MRKSDRDKACPTCKAEPGAPCITGAGKQAQDVHQARLLGVAARRNRLRGQHGRRA